MKMQKLMGPIIETFKDLPLWQRAGVLLLPSMWVILLWPGTPSKPSFEGRSQVTSNINKYLQASTKKSEIDQLRVEVQNSEFSEAIQAGDEKKVALLPKISASEFALLPNDDVSKTIYKDLATDVAAANPLLPRDRIDASIANQEWAANYEQHQRHQYVEEFVENARAKGYEVKLNDKLEVVEVRGIPLNKRYRGLSSMKKLNF